MEFNTFVSYPLNPSFNNINEGLFFFGFYSILFWLQILFYSAALLGWFLENRKTSIKILFVPYYFCNEFISGIRFFRYIKKAQSVNWERSNELFKV
jgi:hypothetical protein